MKKITVYLKNPAVEEDIKVLSRKNAYDDLELFERMSKHAYEVTKNIAREDDFV